MINNYQGSNSKRFTRKNQAQENTVRGQTIICN